MLRNITQHEIPVLHEQYNLTDGHAYRGWSPEEEKIIDRVGEIFKGVNRQMQFELEKEYVALFLALAQQTIDFDEHKYLMCTSASLGIEIIANYLRLNGLSLSLIEPCFDNLADIFKRHHVLLEPFPDEYLDKSDFSDFLEGVASQAICLVTPNNPTGNTLTRANFLTLVDYCRKSGKLLIMDYCFRAYLPKELIFDQYGILRESGISYILIEDTGKTWPTGELKASFLTVSASIFQEIYAIYTDLILHISPFIIKIVTEFIRNSIEENLSYTHHVVKVNRESLYRNLQSTLLTPIEKPYISLSWLKVDGMTGFQLKEILEEKGIYILPGDYFYWSNQKRGNQFIRVALTRDPEVFSRAAVLLGDICRGLAK